MIENNPDIDLSQFNLMPDYKSLGIDREKVFPSFSQFENLPPPFPSSSHSFEQINVPPSPFIHLKNQYPEMPLKADPNKWNEFMGNNNQPTNMYNGPNLYNNNFQTSNDLLASLRNDPDLIVGEPFDTPLNLIKEEHLTNDDMKPPSLLDRIDNSNLCRKEFINIVKTEEAKEWARKMREAREAKKQNKES